MQGNDNNESPFVSTLKFSAASIVLLTVYGSLAACFGYAIAMIVYYPEYNTYDNGWFVLCFLYALAFFNPFRKRTDDQTEEKQDNS